MTKAPAAAASPSAAAAKTNAREEKLLRAALESSDYRTFLIKVFAASVKEGGKCNFAALSRKAGFSSRGFISEVIDGRRRLTSASFPKMLKALALPARLKTYFHLLTTLEEPELNHENLAEGQIRSRIESARAKLEAQLAGIEDSERAADVLSRSRDMLECYAAIGSPELGVTLDDVVRKTGLPRAACEPVLRHFVHQEVVAERGGRFYARNPHLVFSGLGDKHGAKSCYLETLSELKRKATANFKGNDRFFIQSIFSLDAHKFPELRKRLWDVINEFVEQGENDTGDHIGKLLVGFYL